MYFPIITSLIFARLSYSFGQNKRLQLSQVYAIVMDCLTNAQPFQVVWGKISMVDAERRLLAYALKDPGNQHFVLLSDRLPQNSYVAFFVFYLIV